MVIHSLLHQRHDGSTTPQTRRSRSHVSSKNGARHLAIERLEDRTLLSSSGPATEALRAAYGQLPLAFEANQGQSAAPINFVARGSGYALALTPGKAVLALQKPARTPGARASSAPGDVVQLQLVGANPAAHAVGREELITRSNFYFGSDPSQWRTNVPNFGKVEYQEIYPGINQVYYGNQGQLEYDFVVTPGANPGIITLSVQGARDITLDAQGNLVLHTSGNDIVEQRPVVYQDSDGVRQVVSGRFLLEGDNRIGFQVGAYDASRPLVIDPVLSYATYVGGSGDDWGLAITVDGSGDAYVTGFTDSTNFPTASAIQTTLQGSFATFVSELNAAGTALVYSTYLGGSLGGSLTPAGFSVWNQGFGIAVDSAGNAYVAGSTNASNFPTTPGAFQTTYGGGSQDAYVAKLMSATGSLVYSTYLGGSGADGPTLDYFAGNVIAVDGTGNAYVAGPTTSANFPTTTGAAYPNWNSSWGSSGYITEINAAGSGLVYSTYLPGGPGNGVALEAGQVYITGGTNSTSFPITSNAFQKSLSSNGAIDAFVAVLNPALAATAQLVYATYLGGNGGAQGNGIAVDSSGNAYVTGYAGSSFPTTTGAFQTRSPSASFNVFVAKINPGQSGSASLVYSTYLGSKYGSQGQGIAVDSFANAYVTGIARQGFPVTANAIQSSSGLAYRAAFVTTLNATGSALLFSTYVSGTLTGNQSVGWGIALDGLGNSYVTGWASSNFPTTSGAFQTTSGGGSDAFVAKISMAGGAAAAPSANLGKEPPVELAANPLSLASIGGSIDPLLAAAGGGATQGVVLDRALASSQAVVPLPVGADADQRPLALPVPHQPGLDRVFADFDGRPLQELFLGETAFA